MSLLGSIAGGLISGGFGVLNNQLAGEREEKARQENFRLNEMAANNADKRTRAMYNDLQSPTALLEQYQAAGLSPSLMFGGSGAGGGAQPSQGAQGSGAAGVAPLYYGIDPMVGAQLGLTTAQIKKTEAETENINKDTILKDIVTQMKDLEAGKLKDEMRIINEHYYKDGKPISIYEIANECYSYDAFLNELRTTYSQHFNSEIEQNIIRDIYKCSSKFSRDIMVLSQETVDASFQLKLIEALNNINFTEENAQTALQELKQIRAASQLDEEQKNALNDIIAKLGKKGSTTKDIAIVLGIIANSFIQNSGAKVTFTTNHKK